MRKEKDYSLLRPFDLEAAKAGALMTDIGIGTCNGEAAWRYVAGPDFNGNIIVERLRDGSFANPASTSIFRMAPLCWVEGRPVYSGDVLYWNCGGAEFTVGSRMLFDGQMIEGVSVTTEGFTHDIPGTGILHENLTWKKPKRTVKKAGWINIYPLSWMDGRAGAIFKTKTEADSSARSGRIACARVEWEEAIP